MNSTITQTNQPQQALFAMVNNHFNPQIVCCLMDDNNPLMV